MKKKVRLILVTGDENLVTSKETYVAFDSAGNITAFKQRNDAGDLVAVLEAASGSSDYSDMYLTFKALEDGTFTMTRNAVQYSLDGGKTWETLAANTASPTVPAGSEICWKATGLTPVQTYGIGTFSSTGNFEAYGNIMSLRDGDDFESSTELSQYQFCALFKNATKLNSVTNLALPVKTLAVSCYRTMFMGCTNITEAPKLPATTLASSCYYELFRDCTKLVTPPSLPVMSLESYCYVNMFYGCTALSSAPALPAETLASGCYRQMFCRCTSLTIAPELPATTLAEECYSGMFVTTGLIVAPELPATTLTDSCYFQMFASCSNLTTAPELPATTLTQSCYNGMFKNCTSLVTAPELPAATLATNSYKEMFYNCTRLNYIKCLATDIGTSTTNWVYGVPYTSGTFVKAASMNSWASGKDGIPSSWTVVDATE